MVCGHECTGKGDVIMIIGGHGYGYTCKMIGLVVSILQQCVPTCCAPIPMGLRNRRQFTFQSHADLCCKVSLRPKHASKNEGNG